MAKKQLLTTLTVDYVRDTDSKQCRMDKAREGEREKRKREKRERERQTMLRNWHIKRQPDASRMKMLNERENVHSKCTVTQGGRGWDRAGRGRAVHLGWGQIV